MRRSLALGLLVSCGAAATAAITLEVALRVAGHTVPRFEQRDDERGTARRPGARFLYTAEGRGHVHINAAGFRDHEWRLEKPAGTIRIAILGDSYVEAMQVEEHERFGAVAERLLNDSGALRHPVEVMHFGVSGYGTAQELQTLRHAVWPYAPDVVVLALLPANDVRNNSPALEHDPARPYFVFRGGQLVLDESFRQSPEHNRGPLYRAGMWLVDRSHLAAASMNAVRAALGRRSRQAQRDTAGVPAGFDEEAGLDVWVYAEPRDPRQQEAWRLTDAIIDRMRQEVAEHGARFLVMVLPSARQVDPDPDVRTAFMRRLGVSDLYYPERRMRLLSERLGLNVLVLAPPLLEYAEAHKALLHGFNGRQNRGHWNATGHREAGRLLAAKIEETWSD
jgi:lysophospholipase L1-like esterase